VNHGLYNMYLSLTPGLHIMFSKKTIDVFTQEHILYIRTHYKYIFRAIYPPHTYDLLTPTYRLPTRLYYYHNIIILVNVCINVHTWLAAGEQSSVRLFDSRMHTTRVNNNIHEVFVLSVTILADHNTLGIALQNGIFVYEENNMLYVRPDWTRSKHGSLIHITRVIVTSSTLIR